jgi:hypothetical protein
MERHAHMIALHVMHHNVCRVQQTLRVRPAMEAERVQADGKEVTVADHHPIPNTAPRLPCVYSYDGAMLHKTKQSALQT